MIKFLKTWWESYFSDEEALVVAILLAVGLLVILSMGSMLGPVFVGMVVAFLMQGMVKGMERYRVPHMVAVSLVFTLFLGLLFALIFILLPLVWNQLSNLFTELPSMFSKGHRVVHKFAKESHIHLNCRRVQGLGVLVALKKSYK